LDEGKYEEVRMDKIFKVLVFIFVGMIILGFFLPWVNVGSKQVGYISKILTGKQQQTIDSISGFKIPILANSTESRLLISVVKIFNPEIDNVEKKSFLVWLIPISGLAILALSLFLGNNKWVNLSLGIIGTLIFFGVVYKLKTTDLDKIVLQVKISTGLWFILWAYLGVGLISIAKFIKLLKK